MNHLPLSFQFLADVLQCCFNIFAYILLCLHDAIYFEVRQFLLQQNNPITWCCHLHVSKLEQCSEAYMQPCFSTIVIIFGEKNDACKPQNTILTWNTGVAASCYRGCFPTGKFCIFCMWKNIEATSQNICQEVTVNLGGKWVFRIDSVRIPPRWLFENNFGIWK